MKKVMMMVALLSIAFAASPASAQSKKGKMPANVVQPQVMKNTKVLFHMQHDDLNRNGIPVALELIQRLNGYNQMKKITSKVEVVVQGDAAYWFINDKAWTAHKGGKAATEKENKAKVMIQAILKSGAQIEVCMMDLKINGWTAKDLIPGVKVIAGSIPRVIELQSKGWTYLPY